MGIDADQVFKDVVGFVLIDGLAFDLEDAFDAGGVGEGTLEFGFLFLVLFLFLSGALAVVGGGGSFAVTDLDGEGHAGAQLIAFDQACRNEWIVWLLDQGVAQLPQATIVSLRAFQYPAALLHDSRFLRVHQSRSSLQ